MRQFKRPILFPVAKRGETLLFLPPTTHLSTLANVHFMLRGLLCPHWKIVRLSLVSITSCSCHAAVLAFACRQAGELSETQHEIEIALTQPNRLSPQLDHILAEKR